MKIRSISPHALQLTRFGLCNCYLVRETGGSLAEPAGYTLIDTGLPGSASSILDAARAHTPTPIQRILLTHAHGDHIGSLDRLVHMLGRVELAISHREARLLPKPPAQDLSVDTGEPPYRLRPLFFPGAHATPTHLLTDGELFGSLRCIATPGHTPGHFSFLDERDGTLYAGDALVTVGGHPHVSGYGPWYFPLPKFAVFPRWPVRDSVQRLLDLSATDPIRRIAPGHGPVLEGGRDLLAAALKQAT